MDVRVVEVIFSFRRKFLSVTQEKRTDLGDMKGKMTGENYMVMSLIISVSYQMLLCSLNQ
jgi:hypothetical protein